MVRADLCLPKLLEAKTDAYLPSWRCFASLNCFTLSTQLDAIGLHLFFVAGQIKTIAFGCGQRSLRKAIQRIAAKLQILNLNCFELAEIRRRRFLGVPYTVVFAHVYHIQQSQQLPNLEERRRVALQ